MGSADLTQGAALTSLLGAGGFLLAAIALALRLDEPNQTGSPRHQSISPGGVARGAVWVMTALAVGSCAAWWSIFGGGTYRGWERAFTGGALLIVVVAQPVLGWLLAYGTRRD